MMLTMVEIINESDQNLELSLLDQASGYLLADVDGLDPVKATLSSSAQASMPGEKYQSSRRDVRDVTLTIDLLPDYITTDVAGLRRNLYAYLSPARPVTLKFYFDDVYFVYATGRVESFDTKLFTQDPTITIVVRCFDPDFIAASSTVFTGTSSDSWAYEDMPYDGDQETGAIFRYTADQEVSQVTFGIRDSRGNIPELVFINGVDPLVAGDILEVSTVPGDKYARVTSGGVRRNVLNSITLESVWFGIPPGNNEFAVVTDVTPGTAYEVEYIARYGGV